MPSFPRTLVGVAGLFAAATIVSCDDAIVGPDRGPGVDPELLTPAVAAQLTASGHFPRQEHEAGYQQPITLAAAEALARAYIDDSAAAQGAGWEHHHGAPINVERLVRCAPTVYASAAYEVASIQLGDIERTYHVGRYHVQYCSRTGAPQLLVAVSVEPWLLDAPGSPPSHLIQVSAIPLELATPILVTAERAAHLAAVRTGRRVAAVPELVLPRFVPMTIHARWLVQLESPVVIAGIRTGETDTVTAVMVGVDEVGYGLTTTVLRPRHRATPAERIDSVYGFWSGEVSYYTARLGLPRGVETFFVQ